MSPGPLQECLFHAFHGGALARTGVGGTQIAFTVPIRLRGGPNARMHWRRRARLVKKERGDVRRCAPGPRIWTALFAANGSGLWKVSLTRVAPRRVDDDNLAGLLKGVRDEVAALLGINDGSAKVQWLYAQSKGRPRQHAVHIEVAMEQLPWRESR